MSTPPVYWRAMRRAAQIAGGSRALALRLDLPHEVVVAWLEQRAAPGDVDFMRAVDLILDHDRVLPWTTAEAHEQLLRRS